MRILAIIPARGGSKGVPGKNIKNLGGKPLLSYTAEVAFKSSYLSEIILSSDDEDIIEIGRKIGINIPFTRPKHLAKDNTPTIDVIIHALEWYQSQNIFFDAVCLLQVTSPLRTVSFVNQAIKKFINSNCDSLVSVLEVPHEYNPHWTFEINEQGNLKIATGEDKIITRRQELPKAYHRDGSIYITKTNVLLEQKSLLGKTTAFIESDVNSYVNIDTLKDWEKAEQLIKLGK